MNRFPGALASLLLFLAIPAVAQQAVTIGDYTVHYNALATSALTPQVAQTYGIQRSSSRALLNITVLRNEAGGSRAIHARVEARARNLTGQARDIDLRAIEESDDAIYYIGVFRVNHMETYDFMVTVVPEGSAEPLELTFRQQFYTE